MKRWLIKCRFDSPLRLRKAGIGIEAVEDFARSDTIFGAICHSWANLFGQDEVCEMLRSFSENKPLFKVSSAFPFFEDTYFLPKPLMDINLGDTCQDCCDTYKDFNRLPFVSFDMFEKWVNGDQIDPASARIITKQLNSIKFHTVRPRVQLDRMTSSSNLFYSGVTFFNESGGLFFLIEIAEEAVTEKIKHCIRFLSDTGFGGMRSIGCGRFKAEWVEPETEWNQLFSEDMSTNRWCLLSLMHPNQRERNENYESSSFYVIIRDGWASSPITLKQVRRKSCKMFAEGSVLSFRPQGFMVDVTPAKWDSDLHPIFRYGYALAVPVGR